MIVLIGIPQPVIREGLDAVLRQTWPDVALRAAETFILVQEQLATGTVDMLVVGVGLPGLAGPAGLRWLREAHPNLRILVLGDHDDSTLVLECLAVGVNGFATVTLSIDKLRHAIERVASGQIYVPPILAQMRSRDGPAPRTPVQSHPDARLTPRQGDVLRLLREGHCNKEIARQLGLGLGTVKVHLAAAYSAYGAHSRLEAIVKSTPRTRHYALIVRPEGS